MQGARSPGEAVSGILLVITTAIHLWPFILAAVRAAEAAFPIPKAGKDKLDAVLNGIEAAYELAQPLQGLPKDQVLALASKLTTKAVSNLNTSGEFKPAA